jgi:putative nucleotidyltransferase with HDIG domain
MKGYIKLRKKSLEILSSKLSDDLHYHGIHHVLDVLNVCNQYIRREKIVGRDAKLLRIGALLHDIGFTVSNNNHEEHGVEIAVKLMKEFGFSTSDIKVVCNLIMSTKIPQKTNTYLEKVLCDADLDYLGRADFYTISDQLYKELKAYKLVSNKTEWNKLQVKFLEAHSYHTAFAINNRQPEKEIRIEELKKKLS